MEQQMNNSTIEAHKKGPFHDSSSSSFSGISSGSSMESDSFEEVTSPASSSSSTEADLLSDMSSLFQQRPIKRGLSKFYQGKSQSFTSLSSVRSLEDLAKAENPYNKRLKTCKSYGGGLAESEKAKCKNNPSAMSRSVSKRGTMHSTCYPLSARRGNANFMGNRPPIPPHRSTTNTTTIPNQTVLFA
ncbi:hypothetical protein VNO77_43533 [Canavalia gladiata]|uniref:Uncharacterized protein n=1 Tax=Canavalia gladiata TaxID=3824 RepID=A0AAN9PQ03_CANGL